MGWIVDGTPCTIQTENDNEGTNVVLRILDSAGNEVAVCYSSEGDTPPIDVVEKTAASILRAVNMHDRLVAFVESQMRECEKGQDTFSCEGCFGTIPGGIPCDIRALLQEARATNLPGLTDEESALVREHKAEIARGDK